MRWLDRAFERAAADVGQRISRRRAAGMIGKAALSVAFAGTLARSILGSAPARRPPGPAQGTPCSSDNESGARGIKCTNYGVSSATCDCSKCLQPNGCPAGTALSTGWTACVVCPEDTTKGRRVRYADCCGSVDSSKCGGCSAGPLFSGGGSNCYQPGPSLMNWCGGTGSLRCTVVLPSSECCVVANPTPGCGTLS